MSLTPEGDARRQARKPIPKPKPAYLPTAGSPLTVDERQYAQIRDAPRLKNDDFVIPIRSGRAWKAAAGSIIRISTPEGPQVGDLNIWNAQNPRERFWASRTKQLHASHVSVGDRLWSVAPYMRPLATILSDTLAWYGVDEHGGRVHDLLGTGCDPYIGAVLTGGGEDGNGDGDGGAGGARYYDFHCRSNLARAVLPYGLAEHDVHDVINLFQVTGLDHEGRYFMNPCPASAGDYIEFLAEQDLLMALSTCPGGDLSLWGFGAASEKEMAKCCRPLKVEVFRLQDETLLQRTGWKPAEPSPYRGMHGMMVPEGEHQAMKP
ncbi:putative meiotic chromosome segregation protein [Rosellinia necatrix]|uniref:Putative meiotic chromosome segregation protein n=1 Tax=Rosellinia necatrix TaxID=77044 RepID=A0A1W2TB98_ROSNE|nr:putative meiotic chromosome segregation protein [Rosellinia necatrix]